MRLLHLMMAALLISLMAPAASATNNGANSSDDKEKIAAIADLLHDALNSGDADRVKTVLHKDVKILEGRHAQKSRAEYMGGHMKGDMKFLPHVKSTRKNRVVSVAGDLAWIVTHSQTIGTYNGRKIDQPSREMLVLKKTDDKWQITLVHWGKD